MRSVVKRGMGMRWALAGLLGLGCVSGLSGCDNVNRSLIFFTNTTVGVDVGVDPTASSGKVIIGYKRAEGVINPVYQPPISKKHVSAGSCGGSSSTVEHHQVTDLDTVYRKQAYSVLAKIAGEASGRGAVGTSGTVEGAGKVAQWFATGEAARLLAANDFAAAALTGSDNVAKAISERTLGASFEGEINDSDIDTLDVVLEQLGGLESDPRAKSLLDSVDEAADTLLAGLDPFVFYKTESESAGDVEVVYVSRGSEAVGSRDGWDGVSALKQRVDDSEMSLRAVLVNRLVFRGEFGDSSVTDKKFDALDLKHRKELLDELMAHSSLKSKIDDGVKSRKLSAALAEAITYWYSLLVKQEKK